MKIEKIDFFYLSMPVVEDKGDGSQDALLVRIQGGGYEGWGECEASPLVSIAAYITPMSHSGLKSLAWSLENEEVNGPADIKRLREKILINSFDLLQTPHTLSGIDIALWDLLGKKEGAPVYNLLGYEKAYPKTAYASMLFQETPQKMAAMVKDAIDKGYKAVKMGWGPYGRDLKLDEALVAEARKVAGPDITLLTDAGTIWALNPGEADKRLASLKENKVVWLEEPFGAYDLDLYANLAAKSDPVALAGGEGSHNPEMARHLIDYGRIKYIQIDTGRIGGITPALEVAQYARTKGIKYVNHTFTSALALSASLQPFAGIQEFELCEVPFDPSFMVRELNAPGLAPDADDLVRIPEKPGLGIEVNKDVLKKYLVPVTITVKDKIIYQTPEI